MYPLDKKDDDFNFKRVLQCFPPLAMYPFGLKGCKKINFLINAPFGRFSLAMYPSDHFFLKALFLRAPRRNSGVFGPDFAHQFWHFNEDEAFYKAVKKRAQVERQKSLQTYWKTHFWGIILAAYVGLILASKLPCCTFLFMNNFRKHRPRFGAKLWHFHRLFQFF